MVDTSSPKGQVSTNSDQLHSVVLARFPDGREAMLDPLYGIVPRLNGELLSPSSALEASKNSEFGGDIWHKLAPTLVDRFYQKFEHAVFAMQDTGLDIEVQVNLTDNKPIALGRRDGNFKDVRRDGLSQGLTSYWIYLGHKYDRGWTRVLRFTQDTRVEIGLGRVNTNEHDHAIFLGWNSPKLNTNASPHTSRSSAAM